MIDNFEKEKPENNKKQEETLNKMRALLAKMQKDKKIFTKKQIDKAFPNPKKDFILGFTD